MHVSQDQLFMMNVQNQCCQFFKILIKKKSSCFLQRVVGWSSFATRVGCSYVQLEKLSTV